MIIKNKGPWGKKCIHRIQNGSSFLAGVFSIVFKHRLDAGFENIRG
ncbi:hypothetical protein [Methanosarcina mazei]|nr:hypothetical protein [Methanosarcina mazei]